MGDATLKDVMSFFGMSAAEFQAQWARLTPEEKAFFKREVGALS